MLAVVLLASGCRQEPPPIAAAPAPSGPLLSWSVPAGSAPAYERIVLVTIDTLRADHLPSYGYPRDTAPFFAELTRAGVLFERAYAAISHTAPSHASILTGLPPSLHGVRANGERLPAEIPTLQGLFRAAGYESAAFFSVGFLEGVAAGFDRVQVLPMRAPAPIDAVIEWLRARRSAPRFFLWVHLYGPHEWKRPRHVPEWAVRSVRRRPAWDAAHFYDQIAALHGLPDPPEGEELEIGWKGELPTGEAMAPGTRDEVLGFIDCYDAMIRHADGEIARLYRALEELALPGATLWILTSDHGEGLGSHGYAGHGGRLYNEQLRVPLLIHATDGSLAPRRVATLVQLVDLLPTLAELLSIPLAVVQPALAGRSLVPLLRGDAGESGARFAFAEKRRSDEEGDDMGGLIALQDLEHKLIRHQDGQEEFFRLGADPLELQPLDEESPPRAELRRELEARLRLFSSLGRPAADEGQPPPPEWLEELKQLGYVQ